MVETRPEISVIVPVYNCALYLERCLQSLKKQTFAGYDVWIIDDGSTDQSNDIAAQFAKSDGRFHVVRMNNGGAAAARNRGIDVSCGKYVSFVDADDWVDPDYLDVLYAEIDRVDCTICGYQRESSTGRIIEQFFVPNAAISSKEDFEGLFDFLYRRYLVSSVCNKLYKRQILDAHGLRMDVKMAIGEDLLFNLAYLERCSTLMIHSRMPYHYVHRGRDSLTAVRRIDKVKTDRTLFNSVTDFCSRIGIPTCPSAGLIYCKSCLTSIGQLVYPSPKMPMAQIRKGVQDILDADETKRALRLPSMKEADALLCRLLLRMRSKVLLIVCAWIRSRIKAMIQNEAGLH